jgi:hypothetical protein
MSSRWTTQQPKTGVEMAVKRTCDGKCGGKNEAVGAIHVDVWAENVAASETNTGKRISRDSCEKCRPSQMAEMFKEAVTGLETDIPRHKKAIRARSEEAELQKELGRVNRQIAIAPADESVRELRATAKSLEQKILDLQDEHAAALSDGEIAEA